MAGMKIYSLQAGAGLKLLTSGSFTFLQRRFPSPVLSSVPSGRQPTPRAWMFQTVTKHTASQKKQTNKKKSPWFALRTGHEHYTCLLYKSNKNSPGQHVRQHSQQRTVFLRSKTTMLKMLLTGDEWAQGTKDFIVVCFCVFFLILENLKSGLISPSSGRKCVCLSTWLK